MAVKNNRQQTVAPPPSGPPSQGGGRSYPPTGQWGQFFGSRYPGRPSVQQQGALISNAQNLQRQWVGANQMGQDQFGPFYRGGSAPQTGWGGSAATAYNVPPIQGQGQILDEPGGFQIAPQIGGLPLTMALPWMVLGSPPPSSDTERALLPGGQKGYNMPPLMPGGQKGRMEPSYAPPPSGIIAPTGTYLPGPILKEGVSPQEAQGFRMQGLANAYSQGNIPVSGQMGIGQNDISFLNNLNNDAVWKELGFGSMAEGMNWVQQYQRENGNYPWQGPGSPEDNMGMALQRYYGIPSGAAGGSAASAGGQGQGAEATTGSLPPTNPVAPTTGAFGPFPSFQAWQQAFAAEHGGRMPNQVDVQDAMDSFSFAQQAGRAPTQRDWLRRYYTGGFSGKDEGFRPTPGYAGMPPVDASGAPTAPPGVPPTAANFAQGGPGGGVNPVWNWLLGMQR